MHRRNHSNPCETYGKLPYDLCRSSCMRAARLRNSEKSMALFPSASNLFIVASKSNSVGFWPSDHIRVPNSLAEIQPSPSLSKRLKASLNFDNCLSLSWSSIRGRFGSAEGKREEENDLHVFFKKRVSMMHSLFAPIVQSDPYQKFRMEFLGWIHKLNRLGMFVF